MQPPRAQIASIPVSAPAEAYGDQAASDAPLGAQLKTYFDKLTTGPVPDRLMRLTEELEAAFERGELRCGASAAKPR